MFEAIALAVQLQDVDVVGQSIEQRASQPFGAEDLGPFVEGQIRGDQRVLASFAVDQADFCRADSEQRVGSSTASDSVGWPATAWSTIAIRTRRVRPHAVKMSPKANRSLTRPACIAGVRVSRPNLNALCGRMKL